MSTPRHTGLHEAELERARRRIDALVLDGLRHGHFKCSVEVTTVKAKRRELVISAGKSYKFSIPEDEIM